MRQIRWITGLAVVLAACGGSVDIGTQVSTTSVPTTTTTSAAPTTTSTTTTTTTTTTTVVDPMAEEAALARSLLLTLDDFVDGWTETERDEDDDDFDYSQLASCHLMTALQNDESHTVEERSPSFSFGDAEFEQDARVYPSEEDAFTFLAAWTDDSVLPCTGSAFEILSSEAVDAGAFGEVDSFETDVIGGLDEFEGFKLVSYQAILTVTTGAEVANVYLTNWIMQRDRAATSLDFVNVGEDFPGQEEFILSVAQRFVAAGF